ncbi:MAG TPA: tetratricopeptide repeat protein, partial [Candidatus Polarisedimenticolia bacterium]|nr:tetratricopeptide repeat protein [Candidatus Polarisedimenticolia bacterium]
MSQGGRRPEVPKETMAKDPRALLQQAEALRRSGRLSDAIDACLKALDTQPGLDALRVTLGRTYLESGQADLARNTLQEVFDRLPEHHLAGKLLAEAQKETGDPAAAEATCQKLLQVYPRDREIEALL